MVAREKVKLAFIFVWAFFLVFSVTGLALGQSEAVTLISCQEVQGGRTFTSFGCGVYCQYGDLVGVLTVKHGLSGKLATVTFSDGVRQTVAFTVDKYGNDIAFLFATHKTLKPLAIAPSGPIRGQQVQCISRYSQNGRLRYFQGTVAWVDQKNVWYNGIYIVPGDSGAPVLNTRQEVVGVQVYGQDGFNRNAPGSASVGYQQTTAFLKRVAAKCCPSGICPLPSIRPLVPVKPQPEPTVFNYDKLAALVYLKIEANADKFRGPAGIGIPGPIGAPGTDGASSTIDYDELTAEVLKRLPPQIHEIHPFSCICEYCVAARSKPRPSGGIQRKVKPLGEPIRWRPPPR